MTEIIGRQIDFAIASEAVRGTAEATAERTVRKVTCNLIPRTETVIDDSTFGRLEDAERLRVVRKWSEGDVTGIVHADVLGYYLSSLYGAPTSTASSGVNTHLFELEQNILHPTLTFFVKDGTVRQEKISNGVVSSLDLNITTDDYIRFTAGFLGKEGEVDSSSLPPLATEYDFISRDVTVKAAATAGGLSSATPLKLKTLDLTFNANAEADWVFGSYSPEDIYNKQFSVEGTFTRNFTDTTFKDLYESAESRFMNINIEGEATIGTAKHPELMVELAKIQITDWNRSSEGDALSEETVNFKAFLNTTADYQSKVTLQNLTASYSHSS